MILFSFFTHYKDDFNRAQGVSQGIQQTTGKDILLGLQQIQGSMITRDDLERLIALLNQMRGGAGGGAGAGGGFVQREIVELKQVIEEVK